MRMNGNSSATTTMSSVIKDPRSSDRKSSSSSKYGSSSGSSSSSSSSSRYHRSSSSSSSSHHHNHTHGASSISGSKRSSDHHSSSSSSGHPPRKKRKAGGDSSQPKNPVALLNELRQGLAYVMESQSGPVHAPLFTISVEVDGQKYSGQGRSKKMARLIAAESALRNFIQLKDGAVLIKSHLQESLDFTSDELLNENGAGSGASGAAAANAAVRNLNLMAARKTVPDKGPVMLLYELFNDVKFDCVPSDGSQHSRFKMIATANGKTFEGTGPSKKLAKNAAAKAALAALCNISYSPMHTIPGLINGGGNSLLHAGFGDKMCNELPQIIADGIGKMVLQKFNEIMVGHEMYARRKVLAGIVMTNGPDLSLAKVISVSTGTKCVNGEYISVSGSVVNDCHAEIVSRRCLIDYLYNELSLHLDDATTNDSIFKRPDGDVDGLYTLKDQIEFHLYINTAPCGDARIFSPHEEDANLGIDKHPNRKARGQLRTKIESGEGTIPAKNSDGIQTWDGVLQGQRLLTMSCSDKIAKWNVVGIQGALLASIIQPIYLNSIVLGSLLHPAHMYRAVCGRIETSVQNLPPPYQMNRPKLALVTSSEQRNQLKAPNFSVNWTNGCADVEVINSITGKTVQGKISRIAKQGFFMRYGKLVGGLPKIQAPRKIDCDYGEVKAQVLEYQTAKTELFLAFKREDLGCWLKKPMEQDQFHLPNINNNSLTMPPPAPVPVPAPQLPVLAMANGKGSGAGAVEGVVESFSMEENGALEKMQQQLMDQDVDMVMAESVGPVPPPVNGNSSSNYHQQQRQRNGEAVENGGDVQK